MGYVTVLAKGLRFQQPLHDVTRMAGLELPEYLGEVGQTQKDSPSPAGTEKKTPPSGTQS